MSYCPRSANKSQISHQEDRTSPGLSLSLVHSRRIIYHQLAKLSSHIPLSEADIAKLSQRLTPRHYAMGEVIWWEGTHGECLGLVKSGQLAAYSSISSHNTPIAFLLPGSVFGELMLTEGRTSDSTLRATTEVDVLFLRRADYVDLIAQQQQQTISQKTPERKVHWLALTTLMIFLISSLILLKPVHQTGALAFYSIGLWLKQRGQTVGAEISWLLSQGVAPDWGLPHLSLGNLYFQQGLFDLAQDEFEQALNLTPNLAAAHNSMGLIYAAYDDHETAIEEFQHALTLEPGQAIVEGNLAFSLQLLGQQDEALQHYALARLLDTPRATLLVNEAMAHYAAGDLDSAQSTARQVLNIDKASAPAYTVLGAVEFMQQHFDQAALSLEKAIHLDTSYSPAYFYLGLTYKSLNHPARAATAFEHVLALNPVPLVEHEARQHLSELPDLPATDMSRSQMDGERR